MSNFQHVYRIAQLAMRSCFNVKGNSDCAKKFWRVQTSNQMIEPKGRLFHETNIEKQCLFLPLLQQSPTMSY